MIRNRVKLFNQGTHLLIISIVLLLTSCSSYVNLNLSDVNKYDKKGEKDGVWIENDTNSIQISNYKKGHKEGKSKTIYKDGSYGLLNYKEDLKNGVIRYYNSEGTLCNELLYRNDTIIQQKRYCSVVW